MYHDGPATAYLSLAPGELADYEGDGEWFKIAAVGASDGMNWDYRSSLRLNQVSMSVSTAMLGLTIVAVEIHHTKNHTARQIPDACRAS